MVNKEKINFHSSDGINTIVGYVYTADNLVREADVNATATAEGSDDVNKAVQGRPEAILLIAHGMCEYIERYENFAHYMAEKNFVVAGHDHLGHGKSVKSNDDLGYFGDRDGYRFVIEDLHTMRCLMTERYPGVPVILLGHSMGSIISRCYIAEKAEGLAGCILSGTLGPNPIGFIGEQIAKLEIKKRGPKGRSQLLNDIGFKGFNRKITNARTDKDWLTRDDAIVDKYVQDEHCMYVFTAAGFQDILKMSSIMSHKSWAYRIPKELPIYIFSGEMDPCGNYGKGVRIVHDRLKKAGIENLKLKLYSEGRHEMLNEINKEEVYRDVLDWCMSVKGIS